MNFTSTNVLLNSFSTAIGEITSAGVPRSQVTSPICPNTVVTDDVLFEGAIDATQKFYLPRYRVSELNQKVQVSLAPNGQSWNLTIHLERYPAPAIEELTRNAQVIDHSVSVILQHSLEVGNANGMKKELPLESSAIGTDGKMRAVIQVATLEERDLLYRVLTDPDYAAVLMIRRTLKVAVSNSEPDNQTEMVITEGSGFLQGTWLFNFDVGSQVSNGGDVWWEHQTDTERFMVPQGSARIFNLGIVNDADISLAQLQSLQYSTAPIDGSLDDTPPLRNLSPKIRGYRRHSFENLVSTPAFTDSIARNKLVKGNVFAVYTNGGNYAKVSILEYGYDLMISWVTYSPGTPERQFWEITSTLEQQMERNPFFFPANLYSYVFKGITDTTDRQLQPILRSVKGHSYYQDPVQQYLFYYLPDRFKLLRRAEAPRYPMSSLRFSAVDGAETDVQATIEYWTYPFVDDARLIAASVELTGFIPTLLPPGISGVKFQPLVANQPRLFLTILKSDGTFTNQECLDVLVDLRTGFRDTRTFSLKAFQSVYDALFSDTTQLFKGQVKIDLPDRPSEIIPFDARMNDLWGECFDVAKAIDPTTGVTTITLTNQIESPVRITRLTVLLQSNAGNALGAVTQVLPVELKPNELLTFTVTPAPLQSSPVDAILDIGVQVLADREAIWNAILRSDSPAYYKRPITVKTTKAVFGEQIDVISIDLRRGISVDFNSDDPSASFAAARTVFASIGDLVLHREDSGAYEYRIMLILKNGKKVQDPPNQWRTESSETLWITSDDIPKIEA